MPGLSDLANSGVNLADPNAVEAALESDAAVTASAATNVREEPDAVNPEPGEEEEEAAAEGETAAALGEGETAEPGELEPPTPTGEAAQPDAKDQRIAELERDLAAAREQATQNTATQAKSQAAQERAAILAEMVEELGENHPIVKETRRRHAAEDAAEVRDAATAETTISAANQAAHATHVVKTPFLKSLYEPGQEVKLAAAVYISEQIQADPKLAGTKAAEPFTAEHYREVEARLLVEYPEAKAKFYKTGKPAKTSGKVVSLSQVRGGSSPAATGKGAESAEQSRDKLFTDILNNPNLSIDQVLANQGR